jgi:hypothetical protein
MNTHVNLVSPGNNTKNTDTLTTSVSPRPRLQHRKNIPITQAPGYGSSLGTGNVSVAPNGIPIAHTSTSKIPIMGTESGLVLRNLNLQRSTNNFPTSSTSTILESPNGTLEKNSNRTRRSYDSIMDLKRLENIKKNNKKKKNFLFWMNHK